MKPLIAPSLLSANFLKLEDEIRMLNTSEADWIHCDVMDGVFVPNISFGIPVIEAVKKVATLPLDVHLMIVNPDRYILPFKDAGADILTIHYEASIHLHRNLQLIRANGMKAGVVLNPHTPVSVLESIIEEADIVLLMSVNPGFGGQKFIPFTIEKITQLKELILKKNLSTLIEVDGGVNLINAKSIVDAGVDVLVAGSAVFGAENPGNVIKMLKNN